MLLGIKLKATPTSLQKEILSQWMGCARSIWNAKCDEDKYYTTFARKYCPIGTYAPLDQKYSHFKDKDLSPWLFCVPSQILRNSAVNWYDTYRKFIRGECGKPKKKKKTEFGSVHLTRELFSFEKCPDGVTRLFIGTKKYNLGQLRIKNHKRYKEPNSLYIKKKYDKYWVSFCYADEKLNNKTTQKQHLEFLKSCSPDFLNKHVVGIDRGAVRAVQCGNEVYDLSSRQKQIKLNKEKKLKRYQRKMARQQVGSKRRAVTKKHISNGYQKISNIRNDFCHKTSHAIVTHDNNKVIVLEDLRTKNMTKKPKPKLDENGQWIKNGANAKAGLNKAILDKGWHKLEEFIKYKSVKYGKAWFKVSAKYTSQECANCSHTHPNNRKSQSEFICERCGNTDNADRNAAEVIKKRAIKLILHSGTELTKRGVLLVNGRGAISKPKPAKASCAHGKETSKKKGKATTSKVAA